MATDPNTYRCTLHTCFFTFFSPLCFPLEKREGGEPTLRENGSGWVWSREMGSSGQRRKKMRRKGERWTDRYIRERGRERERDGLKNKRRGGKDEY